MLSRDVDGLGYVRGEGSHRVDAEALKVLLLALKQNTLVGQGVLGPDNEAFRVGVLWEPAGQDGINV